MERIAISGSHGFLGENLVKHLDPKQVQRLRRDGKIDEQFDVIFDLATYGNLNSQHRGSETVFAKKVYKANVTRIINEINNLKGKERFIYISTSSVLLPVQTLYSLSKKAAEEYIKHIQNTTGMKMIIVRPFTVVGMGEPREHLIPRLIDSCLNETKMPFIPNSIRDYVSSDDFIDALLLIKEKGEFKGEDYNIGTGIGTSNQEVREIVEKITGKKANLKLIKSMRVYDNLSWIADPSKIKTLGWKPKNTLDQVIEEMIYARKNY